MKTPKITAWHGGILLLGAIHALCFAPGPLPSWALPYVQIATLAALAHRTLTTQSVRGAFGYAWLFGLSNFALGVYWVFISMHRYGGMAAPLAALALFLFAAFLALFYGAACAVARAVLGSIRPFPEQYGTQLIIAITWASAWTAFEWVRGTIFTGFPWLNAGYAHVDSVLAGWAPVLGVYGMAWLSAFAAAAIALMAGAKTDTPDARVAVSLGVAILTGLAGILLGHVRWFDPAGDPILVRLVQGNIPQSEKFDPAHIESGIADYLMLAGLAPKEENAEPDVIVLPETVVPLLQDRVAPSLWQSWIDVAAARNATVIMGVPLHDQDGSTDRYTNSAIGFDADTSAQAIATAQTPMRYDKNHLVPFGEFVPPGFRWFVDTMQIPLGDFNRGAPRQPVFTVDGQRIAPNICFEDVFGEEIIRSVRDSEEHGAGATMLVNISNLAWFGDTWALRQHLQISRVRAMETARPMLRATNTGMTAAIAPTGAVRAALQPQQPGVLDVEVQGTTGMTPYTRFGNMPIGILVLSGLAAGVLLRRRTHHPDRLSQSPHA